MNMRRTGNYNGRQPSVSIYRLFKDEARRFCSETGLHGFQFISMEGNTPTERFIWTLISFGALILALTLSTMSWMYSTHYPTMIVTDSMEHPINTFLFPGLSVCNLNKISKRLSYEFVKDQLKVENVTYWQDRMQLLAQLYFANYDTNDSKSYQQLQDLLDKNNITAESALVQVTPRCKDFLQGCSWKGRKVRCASMFQAQRTPEGTCCTFNNYAMKNRVFSGYMAERYKPYPRKLASCGEQSGLTVLLHVDPNDYLVSELSAYAAKVLVHDTYNYPDWSAQRVLIPLMRLIYVDINPSKTYATAGVRAMSVEKRGCVLTSERTLALYSNYSYENCLAECRIRILEKLCNCMPFYLRNEWARWYRPLRMCNLRDIHCISVNKHRFMSSVPGFDPYQTKSRNHVWGSENNDCDCLPDCENRIYAVHSTHAVLSAQGPNQRFFATKPIQEYSKVSMFFKDLTATRTKRDVTISWSAIFGLFGGLLGLCVGFTFTAVIDVIYTFIIRIGINIYRRKKELRAVHHAVKVQHSRPTNSFNVLPIEQKRNKRQDNIWFIN